MQAQEFLNDAQNDLKSVSATKMQFKEPEVKQTQQQIQQPQYQQQPTPDPKAQSWAEKKDWFGKDKVRTAAALAIDADLKEEGFNPNKMISTLSDALTDEENDVSSQGFTEDQKLWDRGLEAAKKAGLTENDYIEQVGERPKA